MANHFNATLSRKDDYYMRIHLPKSMNICGNVIGVHPITTSSANPYEKLVVALIDKTETKIVECLIKEDICEERGMKEGDNIECDYHQTMDGLPENVGVLFCADTSKNESAYRQGKNIAKSITPEMKEKLKLLI